MEGQLRVTPQDLINTSTDFSSRGQTVNSLTQRSEERRVGKECRL